MQKFFLPSSLFALRELALRYVARRSNNLMRSYLADRGLADTEPASPRLLVCITPRPGSSRLVRAGRRMADETRAEWTVVFVETPDLLELSPEEQDSLSQHFRLAEMLGARVETLTGRSVADTLLEYTSRHRIQKVVVGRSTRKRWRNPLRQSLADRLQHLEPTLNVYVVGEDQTSRRLHIPRLWQHVTPLQLLASLGLVLAPTVLGLMLWPGIISRSANLIMLYLVAVLVASAFLGLLPALLTTVLSALVFDYLFIPPLRSLGNFAPEYSITFFSLLLISGMTSSLVARQRALTRAAQRRTDQVTHLYELSHSLAQAVDMPEILETIVQHVSRTFDRDVVIWLAEKDQLVFSASSSLQTLDSSERTAAEWAFQQGRPAGAQTGTFSYTAFRYLPLHTSKEVVGVLGIRFSGPNDKLHPEQERLLSTSVTKAATSIERGLLAEQASQAEILRATEKLQTALLNSISHDLRTPLASITGVLSTLRLEDDWLDNETRHDLVETAFGEAERLNRLVGNLLDMSRLESGMLKISLQPCDVQDVVGSALNSLGTRLDSHPVEVNLPPDLPLVPIDYVLIAQVLINLLENAVKYSPEGQPIEVCAHVEDHHSMQVEICDHGPGIPPEEIDRIFEKFYRVKRFENVIGTGLGLSICKGIVEVHGGKIWAENRPEGGVRFVFTLPLVPAALGVRELAGE
jgi:two-component system, OmpR family, sensor histidine kinase KdpD